MSVEQWRIGTEGGNSSIERPTCRFANLSATNLAYFEPGANVCLWANWPTANCLVHGIAVE